MERVWAYKQLDSCKYVYIRWPGFKNSFSWCTWCTIFFLKYKYETPSVPSFWPIWKPGFCRTHKTNIIKQVLNVNFDNPHSGFHNIPLISKFRLGSFRHQVWCYFHWLIPWYQYNVVYVPFVLFEYSFSLACMYWFIRIFVTFFGINLRHSYFEVSGIHSCQSRAAGQKWMSNIEILNNDFNDMEILSVWPNIIELRWIANDIVFFTTCLWCPLLTLCGVVRDTDGDERAGWLLWWAWEWWRWLWWQRWWWDGHSCKRRKN